ncbi:hypothetical protein Xind_03880 [Xenorhabdus indica]|nr:hypothetical protein [Xenorhabdus indica]
MLSELLQQKHRQAHWQKILPVEHSTRLRPLGYQFRPITFLDYLFR